jgi:hypothetical protein
MTFSIQVSKKSKAHSNKNKGPEKIDEYVIDLFKISDEKKT